MRFISKSARRILMVSCLLGVWTALCSCKKQEYLLNEKKGNRELSAFSSSQIVKHGGSNSVLASSAVADITNYVYSEDKDGFQVLCAGNKVEALRNMFQPAFGAPALASTNEAGAPSFVYSVRQTGVAIQCGLQSGVFDGRYQELTHLVIVRRGALE